MSFRCSLILTTLMVLNGTFGVLSAGACAMFTWVQGDAVLMGNNEDYIRPGHVWFVPGDGERYGRVNFGFSDHFAQGSMNEKGLCFDAAVVAEIPWESDPAKEDSENLLEHIMNTCGTVEEALQVFKTHNCEHLKGSQFMLADATGAAVVVTWMPEKGLSVVRRTADYLINTNTRLEWSHYRCERYVLAERKIVAAGKASLEAARDTLDTIHQEGKEAFTSYSNVYDLKNGLVHIYNLANYDEVVTFKLSEELAKGPHGSALKNLFNESPSLRRMKKASPRVYETRKALSKEQLTRFEGKYSVMDGQAIMDVQVVEDELLFTPPEGKPAHLFPESEIKFRIREGGQLTFIESKGGEVTGFVMHRNGDHTGTKISE